MLRLLADENFNRDIVRGLLLRNPLFDILLVQDIELAGREDPEVLAWASQSDRILLTHDRATMPHYAYERLEAGQKMPGLFIVNDRFPVGNAIEEIQLLNECSEHAEWNGQVVYLPL